MAMVLKKRYYISLFGLALVLSPISALASNWDVTNVHVYVHKDLDTSGTAVRLQSAQCTPGAEVGETATCPSVGYFVYGIDTKKAPTSSFPYAVYTKSIYRAANAQLPANNWWTIRASNLDGGQSTRTYSVPMVMNNTVATFKSNGTTSADAPANPPDGDPLTVAPPEPADPADGAAEETGGPMTVGFSGGGVPEIDIDDSRCDTENSETVDGVVVYKNGILKGVPCAGTLKTLDGALILVKNVTMVFLLPLVGTLFLIMLIIGGILYITSRGNQQQTDRAKKTLTAAIVGLIIVTLSYTIIVIFAGVIGGGIV